MENYDWALNLNSREYVSEANWYDLTGTIIPHIWYTHKIVAA